MQQRQAAATACREVKLMRCEEEIKRQSVEKELKVCEIIRGKPKEGE